MSWRHSTRLRTARAGILRLLSPRLIQELVQAVAGAEEELDDEARESCLIAIRYFSGQRARTQIPKLAVSQPSGFVSGLRRLLV